MLRMISKREIVARGSPDIKRGHLFSEKARKSQQMRFCVLATLLASMHTNMTCCGQFVSVHSPFSSVLQTLT